MKTSPLYLKLLALALSVVSWNFPALCAQGPRLTIERAPSARSTVVRSMIMRHDGGLVLSVYFYSLEDQTEPRTQILIADADGKMIQRFVPPQIDAFPNPVRLRWICRSVFGDGSLLVDMDVPSAILNWSARVRVLTNGLMDSASSGFASGPAVSQADGSVVIGVSVEDSSDWPLKRYVLRDDAQGQSVAEDFGFGFRAARDVGVAACVGVAAANDGRVWAWLRPKAMGSCKLRLTRFLSTGEKDPSFKPPSPIEYDSGDCSSPRLWPIPDGRLWFQISVDEFDNGLRRLNADGSMDTTIRLLTDFGGWPLLALPDFGLLASFASDGVFGLIRFAPDGSEDPTFKSQYPLNRPLVRQILRQPNGRFVILESDWDGPGLYLSRFALNPDGSIDRTFDPSSLAAASSEGTGLGIVADGLRSGQRYQFQTSRDISKTTWEDSYRFSIPPNVRQPVEIWTHEYSTDAPPSRFWWLIEVGTP